MEAAVRDRDHDELAERAERAHELNKRAIESVQDRSQRLDEAAKRSDKIVERAVRRLLGSN